MREVGQRGQPKGISALRDLPHPTFADAKATFSREREKGSRPTFTGLMSLPGQLHFCFKFDMQQWHANSDCCVYGNTIQSDVIRNIRHRGPKLLFDRNNARGVPAPFADKLRRILTGLNGAGFPESVNLPGFGLHQMTGDRAGTWSIIVTKNWRVTFRIEGGDAIDVDYEDNH